MRSESVSKIAYYRKQSVEKLYKLLKQKVLIDMRKVKRFRIWQILVLKRKIALFMRRVKETNRRFLQRSLKVIIEVLKKPLVFSFRKIFNCDKKPHIPLTFGPQVATCLIFISYLKLMNKSNSSCLLPRCLQDLHLTRKAFFFWKSRAYPASPFLQRKLVLILSVMGIVLRRRWRNVQFGFCRIARMSERIESIPLCKAVLRLVHKKLLWAYRKVYQPRFKRRKTEVKKLDPAVYNKKIKTSSILLESMINKKQGIERKIGKFWLSQSFNLWKQLSNENQVPKFILKRQCKSWGCKIMQVVLTNLQKKVKKSVFGCFPTKTCEKNKPENFPIDKNLIINQALVLARLESQHYNKLKELKKFRKLEKLNKCKIVFWKGMMRWMDKWKIVLFLPDDQQVKII